MKISIYPNSKGNPDFQKLIPLGLGQKVSGNQSTLTF
jgi:hypothetical protein